MIQDKLNRLPNAAIYVRKSKATDKGESIENQIKRCQALCELRGWQYEVFEDYDVSGATLNRPSFEVMMSRLYNGEFQYLVCYKLDRVSRSTSDFSNLIKELENINVAFLSIKENFDLTTPMGKAMMMVTSVFAELERETIAERVRDNMIDRAKLGKWNGGPVPFGYKSEKSEIETPRGVKKVSKLVIEEKEADLIKNIYKWYISFGGSIRNVTSKCNEMGFKTKNNKAWGNNQISRILENPLYCINDNHAYYYFKENTKVNVVDSVDSYNGENGLMYYNRRKTNKVTNNSKFRDEEYWILSVAEHQGIIPGDIFARAQNKRNKNANKAPRAGQSLQSPLAGLVKCNRCGLSMLVSSAKKNKESKGYDYSYFKCQTRTQRSKVLCDNHNMRADYLEELIVNYIKSLCDNEKFIEDILDNSISTIEDKTIPLLSKRNELNSMLDSLKNEKDNLVDALAKGILPELIIKGKFNELQNKENNIIKELNNIENDLNQNYVESLDISTVTKNIKQFNKTYSYLSIEKKKELLCSIIKEIRVDRNEIILTLHFLPSQSLDSLGFCNHKDNLSATNNNKLNIRIPNLSKNEVIYNKLDNSSLANRLKRARLKLNLTNKELSRLSNVSTNVITNIEKGHTLKPNLKTLTRLSLVLNITNTFLLYNRKKLPKKVNEQILHLRIDKGLSQRELARITGLHQSTIKDYEAGNLRNKDTLNLILEKLK